MYSCIVIYGSMWVSYVYGSVSFDFVYHWQECFFEKKCES